MKITLKLFAALTDYLPAHGRDGNLVGCEVAAGATIQQIIDTCGLPPRLVHLVLVNGVYVAPEARAGHALTEGDVLAIWPPIAGG